MFEQKAEEYAENTIENWNYKFSDEIEYKIKQTWQDGAEYGYGKANEWQYPSKGEYPKETKRYLCKIKAFVSSGIDYECFDYDTEYCSWKNASGDVIAWKEIIPPKGSEYK